MRAIGHRLMQPGSFLSGGARTDVTALMDDNVSDSRDSAVTELCLEDFERKTERLHQCSALIANSAVDLNAEAITQFGMLLQILLNWGVRDMGTEGFVVRINL